MSDVTLVAMRKEHIESVVKIERQAFKVPWTERSFRTELARPESSEWRVAQEDGRVVGYCGLMQVGREGHVTNLAVEEGYRRQGVATMLLTELIAVARRRGIRCLTLEVRESNDGAKALYEQFGFRTVGRRKRYYPEDNEDALIMWKYDLEPEN